MQKFPVNNDDDDDCDDDDGDHDNGDNDNGDENNGYNDVGDDNNDDDNVGDSDDCYNGSGDDDNGDDDNDSVSYDDEEQNICHCRYTGALSGLTYIFTLPCVIHMMNQHDQGKLTWTSAVGHSFIILLGILNMVSQFVIRAD